MKIDLKKELVKEVVKFHFNSGDFNGIRTSDLWRKFNINGDDGLALLAELIDEGEIELVFGSNHPNPHIKAFPAESKESQKHFLFYCGVSRTSCVYPSHKALKRSRRSRAFTNRPYTLELANGCGQLEFRVFDLMVLEHYRNDPRYFYETNSISGSISIENEYFESRDMPDSDQILLETFGFAFDEAETRSVAVYLRYLSRLSPEHQSIWKSRQLDGEFQLHPDYYRSTVIGDWVTRISIFEAFIEELILINKMTDLIKKPNFFNETFEERKPRNFDFLLRPTLAECNSFVLLLDQMMSDNINKKFFENDIELQHEIRRKDGKIEIRSKGTITLLEEWIRQVFATEDTKEIEQMIAIFRNVRTLRQKPAHSAKENVFDKKYCAEQRSLAINAYKAVKTIRSIFEQHPRVKANPPEISEALRSGRIWNI